MMKNFDEMRTRKIKDEDDKIIKDKDSKRKGE